MGGRYSVALVGKIVPDKIAYFGFVVDDENVTVLVHATNFVHQLSRMDQRPALDRWSIIYGYKSLQKRPESVLVSRAVDVLAAACCYIEPGFERMLGQIGALPTCCADLTCCHKDRTRPSRRSLISLTSEDDALGHPRGAE